MTLPTGFSFATATPDDRTDVLDFDQWSFPSNQKLEDFLKQPEPFTWDRSVIVRDDNNDIAGFHTSYPFATFNVPGASVEASGLSWVGVHPQHRRKGILRSMIKRHFADCVARKEVISVLYAAEPTIYGRFGYGRSAHDVRFSLGRGASQRELVSGLETADDNLTVRIEKFDPSLHVNTIESLHAQAGQNVNGTGLNRPGWATRETEQLRAAMHFVNQVNPTRESPRIVIIERSGVPVAYAVFRRTVTWQDTGPAGEVHANEVVSLDPGASRKIWSVLADLDLTDSVSAFMVPTDDPLIGRLENSRSIKMHHVDNVWTRIIDLPKALEERQYVGDLEIVLEVSDEMIPENAGRWKLSAAAFDGASGSRTPKVERTDDPADITIDIRELGTIYLGGVTLASLAASGLVQATSPRALASASAAFGWPHAPMSTWVF